MRLREWKYDIRRFLIAQRNAPVVTKIAMIYVEDTFRGRSKVLLFRHINFAAISIISEHTLTGIYEWPSTPAQHNATLAACHMLSNHSMKTLQSATQIINADGIR